MFKFAKNIPKPVIIGSALAATFGFACLTKEWTGGDVYRRDVLATDKVAIVTGANTGIGKEVAWDLARRGAKVYMACRDLQRCEKARVEIVMDTKNKYVYCRKCDLASLSSVREFADKFKEKESKLDVLVNNAGVMRPPKSKTKEGFEVQLGVNHMGHYLLTRLLLDRLKESAPSRIVNVSSVAHLKGKINFQDLNSDSRYDPAEAYYQSKLANVLFTRELARRLKGTGVTANAVDPGLVDTEIIRHMKFYNSWMAAILIKPFAWPFIKSPKQGAQTVVYAALEPTLEKISGEYFRDYKKTDVSETAKDDSTAAWLWAVSEKWTKLNI